MYSTPSAQNILSQLESIANDPLFNASPRLKKYLCYLVEQTLAGNAHQLKAYTIGTDLFGRGPDFDPLHDPVVRMETAKLRSKLMEYYYTVANPGEVRIEIPKGGYIPLFTWLKDSKKSTPGANAELDEEDAADGQPVAVAPDGKPSASGPQISIAVLPFINLSKEQLIDTNFIDGLAREITVALTRFEEISVASSLLVQNLHSNSESIFDVARQLGVRFILHGSVRSHKKLVKVTAELADMVTGSNIWAEQVEADIHEDDFLAMQEEFANRLSSRIADSFGSIRRKLRREVSTKPPEDLEFYERMLSYHQWVPTFDPDLFNQAKRSLECIHEREPNNAVVLASLADLYGSDYQMAYNTVPCAIKKCQEFALRAIALDGSSQTAHWSLALHFFLQRNEGQFRNTIQKVVPLNPANSHMLMATGFLVGLSGDFDEGIDLMERALHLNPAAPSWYRIVSYFKYYLDGNFQAALNMALLINTPTCFWDPMLRAAAYGRLGEQAEGEQALKELLDILPDFPTKSSRYIHGIALKAETVRAIEDGLRLAGAPLPQNHECR